MNIPTNFECALKMILRDVNLLLFASSFFNDMPVNQLATAVQSAR
jgi:hypothetical protein